MFIKLNKSTEKAIAKNLKIILIKIKVGAYRLL